ncbi:uroporphyrinogen-III synthase [Nonlabens ponticola]|uniref:Uroporphyrinogen-III synthase n=1 Tax=Nonlabens ponticola TaxID=2496866 RepID=A0A3S9MW57_9FLAO|nr:uroporphyrinogen-III synthase [Nonlabens ponticola]AZQ43353.1 uroporphyrinogen-III synthase [Nonlabens ponticola]
MASTLLSTRLLTVAQQELVLNSGHGLVHYACLEIIDHEVSMIDISASHIIITSSNAITALKKIPRDLIQQVYCVGEKTAARVEDMGLKPAIVSSNSTQLAHAISQHHPTQEFLFLCGKDRREELPAILKKNNVLFKEIIVYESVMVPKSFDRKFAAVLMFSPRGVYAFAKANNAQPDNVICIGETTAQAAREIYKVVHVATKHTVENVIVTAIKVLNNDKK